MADEINSLNTYLANLAVLNIKIHNLHWNVVGREFKAIHKLTEKIYHKLNEQFDAVAEAMKMQGELPMATITDYMDNAIVEEIESRDYSVGEVLQLLDQDCEKIINLALDIRNEADEEGNFLVANMFEEYLAEFYKISWFVKAMLADDNDIEIAEWEEISEEDGDDQKSKPKSGKDKKGSKESKEKKKK